MTRARGLLLAVALLLALPVAPAMATSCAPHTPAGDFARAGVVLTGRALPGPTVDGVLTSPARFKVAEYQKGEGPAVVKVNTALTRHGEMVQMQIGGINPRPGERWQIFGTLEGDAVHAGLCDGSRPLKGHQAGFSADRAPSGAGVLDDRGVTDHDPGPPVPGYRVVGALLVTLLLTGAMLLVARRGPRPALT